jgi:hypothetical protein
VLERWVIASDLGAFRSLYSAWEGMLVPPYDVDHLAAAIADSTRLLLTDYIFLFSSWCPRWSHKGYEPWDIIWELLKYLFDSLHFSFSVIFYTKNHSYRLHLFTFLLMGPR